jgi:hypothetical protein
LQATKPMDRIRLIRITVNFFMGYTPPVVLSKTSGTSKNYGQNDECV